MKAEIKTLMGILGLILFLLFFSGCVEKKSKLPDPLKRELQKKNKQKRYVIIKDLFHLYDLNYEKEGLDKMKEQESEGARANIDQRQQIEVKLEPFSTQARQFADQKQQDEAKSSEKIKKEKEDRNIGRENKNIKILIFLIIIVLSAGILFFWNFYSKKM